MIRWIAALCALVLAGCAAKLVEDDFKGPTAVVEDSYANYDGGSLVRPARAEFFYMSKADDTELYNALQKTATVNEGRGFAMRPQTFERRVPIRTMQVTIEGLVYYAAPIAELFNDSYHVKRTVSFTPAAGETYVVRGKLGPNSSKVWIETAGGRRVAE